jgi:hypothetical protein
MVAPKVALITDTHFGARKGNQTFHDYFEKFYNEIFFPTLDERGIDTLVHLGDCFDVRRESTTGPLTGQSAFSLILYENVGLIHTLS